MTALILKDLMTIQRPLKFQTLFLLLLLLVAMFMQEGSMIFAFIVFIATFQTITALTYDELCNWDKYANTLPISKGDIVLSKYLLSMMLMIIGLVIALPFVFLIHHFVGNNANADLFLTFNLVVAAAFCMLAVLLPIYIKFGSIKGRFVLIALCFIPGFLVGLFDEYLTDFLLTLSKLKDFSYFAPFAGLVILWLSSLLATTIYKRKDF